MKGASTCNYSGCCGVCDISADRNHLGKMHLKCLDTGTGSIGPSLFCDQVASTVQANGDLETSWAAVDSPQTVTWQNDVTICLEIDCVNTVTATGIRRVPPATDRTSGPAAPALTGFWYCGKRKEPTLVKSLWGINFEFSFSIAWSNESYKYYFRIPKTLTSKTKTFSWKRVVFAWLLMCLAFKQRLVGTVNGLLRYQDTEMWKIT